MKSRLTLIQNKFCIFLTSITLLLSTSCKKNKFTLSPQAQDNPPLMLSGYYDFVYKRVNDSLEHKIIFFYANGVVLFASSDHSQLNETENDFKNGKYYALIKNEKNSWGPFKINDGILEFQRWYAGQNVPVHQFTCRILNNQSFEIYQTASMVRGKKKHTENMSDVYTFKAFGPRPNSTNKYVK